MDNLVRALIVLFSPTWAGIARLPHSLDSAGFRVATLCPRNAYLARTRFVDLCYPLPLRSRRSQAVEAIIDVIRDWQPTLLIPGDDRAVDVLISMAQPRMHQLWPPVPATVRRLCQFSLGSSADYRPRRSRQGFWKVAKALGLRVPEQAVAPNSARAEAFARRHGYPVVLKREGTSAGSGVRICRGPEDLRAGFQTLANQYVAATVRRRILQRLRMNAGAFDITIQSYIEGKPAMVINVAHEGRMLAALMAIKERTHPHPTGPSSVVRLVNDDEAFDMTRRVVAALGMTGYSSCDFIIEAASGRPYMIEFNPRPTPIAHLGSLVGCDLARPLHAICTGQQPKAARSVVNDCLVALYPQEMRRNPASPYFVTAHHDIPDDDPELRACFEEAIRSYRRDRGRSS